MPLKEVYKAKINAEGMIDKLKARIVFRGDLHNPTTREDPWNPHADAVTFKFCLAICARYGIHPAQHDFVMAYVQTELKGERVFVELPQAWNDLLPFIFQTLPESSITAPESPVWILPMWQAPL